MLSSGGSSADFAVFARRGIGSVAFALFAVTARAVMCFAGRGANPVPRIFIAICANVNLRSCRLRTYERSEQTNNDTEQRDRDFHGW